LGRRWSVCLPLQPLCQPVCASGVDRQRPKLSKTAMVVNTYVRGQRLIAAYPSAQVDRRVARVAPKSRSTSIALGM